MELTTHSLRALIAHGDRKTIALACGVDRTTVSRWANGRLSPHVRYLPNIAHALGLRFAILSVPAAPEYDSRAFRAAILEADRHSSAPPPTRSPNHGNP